MGSVRSLCHRTTWGTWGAGLLGCAPRARTLADDELLHAVLELGCAAQPPGRALQSVLPLGEPGPQRRDLALEHLLLGQGRGMSTEHPAPVPRRPPALLTLPWCWAGLTGSTVLQKAARRDTHSSRMPCRVLALPHRCPCPVPVHPRACGRRVREQLLPGHPHPAAAGEWPCSALHSWAAFPGLEAPCFQLPLQPSGLLLGSGAT